MNLSHKDPGMVTTSPPDVFADVLFVCFLFFVVFIYYFLFYLLVYLHLQTFRNYNVDNSKPVTGGPHVHNSLAVY